MYSQIRIRTITFNDNLNYHVVETPGLEMPPIRQSSFNLAGEHFGVFVSAFYGKRAFSIRGWVAGESVNDYLAKRDALQLALDIITAGEGAEQEIVFVLPNGREVSIWAVLTNLDFAQKPGMINAGEFNASFQASYPFLVSTVEGNSNITMAVGGGGKVPPDTMPMALGGNSGGSVSLFNNGNAIYYPTVRITGPVTNPAVRNETLGKELRVNYTVPSGGYVDIDFKRKTITDNTGLDRYANKAGEWWFLQPGQNIIRFVADAYDASAIANIKYRDAYLGI